jgi:O-antigen ligase
VWQDSASIRTVYIYGFIVTSVILLHQTKAIAEGRASLELPRATYPIGALILLGLAQGIEFSGSNGSRWSLSMDVKATRETVIALFFLLITFLTASNFFYRRERLKVLANFLVIYGLAIAVFALGEEYLESIGVIHQTEAYEGVRGPFANRNHFAGYMEMLAPFPVALVITRAVRGKQQVLCGVAAALIGVAVIGSLSRAGMVCLAIEVIFILGISVWSSRRHRCDDETGGLGDTKIRLLPMRAAAVVAIVTVIAIGSFSISAKPAIERFSHTIHQIRSNDPEVDFTAGRRLIWRDTLEMIRSNLLFGVGLGAYRAAYPVYRDRDGSPSIFSQSHNDYLQVLADCGIVGGLIAVWFLVSVFHTVSQSIRASDPLLSGVAFGSAAAILGILIHSLVDFNLQLPSNALLFLLLLAVASRIASNVREKEYLQQRAN